MGGDAVIYTTMDSPLGELLLLGDGETLHGLHMQAGRDPLRINPRWQRDDEAFADVREQLEEYFAGARTTFDIPMHMEGTAFQRTVWHGPDRARAVGTANGQNPIAVIVPCHRVIGANGKLVGYGGGLDNKRRLLELESGVLSF
jgi:methylated-DNA-[protein]-cysteine S-methyltransferase